MNSSLIGLALLDGVTQSALLFLVALGLTLIFGVMRIVNVAHGSLYAFGGYAAATAGSFIGGSDSVVLSLLALVVGAVVVGAVLGAIIEIGVVRRILDFDPVMQLLATFAVFVIMEDLQRMIWGRSPVSVTHAVDAMGTLKIGVVTYTVYQLVLLPAVAVLVFVGLRWSLGHTRFAPPDHGCLAPPGGGQCHGHQRQARGTHHFLSRRRARSQTARCSTASFVRT